MHGKDDIRTIASHLKRDRRTFRRIIGCIGQKVEQDLPHAVGIGSKGFDIVSNIDIEPDIMFVQTLADALCSSGNLVGHRYIINIELHDAGIDRCKIENVVDDGQKHRRRRADMI
ncbi:hypothetical protein D9M70_624320 [compost metagenome]